MVSATDVTINQCYDFDVVLPMMRLLCGRTRVEILSMLADGPADVHSIAERLSLDIKSVSQQLQTLRDARLTKCRIDWRRHTYHLSEIVRVRQHPRMLELTVSPVRHGVIALYVPCKSMG